MVLFKCLKCNKMFNKKSTFIIHTEHKKKPCVKKEELVAQKNEELLIYTQKSQKNEQNNVKKHIFIDNIDYFFNYK